MVMRPIGTAEELQRRRIRAVELVDQGESPDEVAHFLGCGRSSVYTWVKQAKQSLETLAAKPHPGPTPRLNSDQLKQLEDELKKGAKHHGWKTEMWTAARVTVLIERLFRITFHGPRSGMRRRSATEGVRPCPTSSARPVGVVRRWCSSTSRASCSPRR